MATKNELEPFTRISVDEAEEMLKEDDVALIDVRESHEFEGGHVSGAALIPVNSVYARREELLGGKRLLFVCARGQRSALAAEMAAAAGRTELFNVEGGMEAWASAGKPVER